MLAIFGCAIKGDDGGGDNLLLRPFGADGAMGFVGLMARGDVESAVVLGEEVPILRYQRVSGSAAQVLRAFLRSGND